MIDVKLTGKNIKRLMKEKHLSVKDVAEMMNLSEIAIYHWLSGVTLPSVDNLFILANILDVTVDSLVVRERIDEQICCNLQSFG